VTASDLPWFAVRVKSRCEKMVSELLRYKGYEEFLPLYWSRRPWSDRIKLIELPLFAGYLFCRFDPLDRVSILATPGVFLIVGQRRAPVAVESWQVESIRMAVSSGQRIQPWPHLEVGRTVRIEMGPLRGIEGTLLRFKGSSHLIVGVQLLQRSVAVEVDESWVIPSKPMRAPADTAPLRSTSGDNLRRQIRSTTYDPIVSS
jgi:transcription antitermination factor NusG